MTILCFEGHYSEGTHEDGDVHTEGNVFTEATDAQGETDKKELSTFEIHTQASLPNDNQFPLSENDSEDKQQMILLQMKYKKENLKRY